MSALNVTKNLMLILTLSLQKAEVFNVVLVIMSGFLKKNHIEPSIQLKQNYQENKDIELSEQNLKKKQNKPTKNTTEFIKKNVSTNLNSQDKSNFTFFKFLSYILVIIISFIALIIILDTFKTPLYSLFPKLEFFLFSLFETLKDINLFIKDLI